MEQLMKKGLDGTRLKTVALVLMVLDHIHYFFEFTGWVPTWFSMLGAAQCPAVSVLHGGGLCAHP